MKQEKNVTKNLKQWKVKLQLDTAEILKAVKLEARYWISQG